MITVAADFCSHFYVLYRLYVVDTVPVLFTLKGLKGILTICKDLDIRNISPDFYVLYWLYVVDTVPVLFTLKGLKGILTICKDLDIRNISPDFYVL